MRISDWSSDVCSSDLFEHGDGDDRALVHLAAGCRRAADRGGAALELLHAERDALLLGIDVEHDRFAGLALAMQVERVLRSEERRVVKESVSTCRSRWAPSH